MFFVCERDENTLCAKFTDIVARQLYHGLVFVRAPGQSKYFIVERNHESVQFRHCS